MKKIRIKSFILRERVSKGKESVEEKVSDVPEKELEKSETNLEASVGIEKDVNFVEMDVTEKNYGFLCHIFLLNYIPFKLIKEGIEIDLTGKEATPNKDNSDE